ncbi:MAG: permease of phosphate ABC transporter [Oscillibacter sp.]|nr:permease of phosphate ABC transporter [Oscillibacter sp.]
MNRVREAARRWLRRSTWRDLTFAGLCIGAIGALIGLAVPGRKKRGAAWIASLLLAAAYVPLMGRFLPFLLGDRMDVEDIYGG